MPSATADTNIYISALMFGGLPRQFLDLAAASEFRLDVSEAILSETLRVLRIKFQWSDERLETFERTSRSVAHLVTPTQSLTVIEADPSDDRILECAIAARSDYIVSGDRHLLTLQTYERIPILQVAAFLDRLQSESSHQH